MIRSLTIDNSVRLQLDRIFNNPVIDEAFKNNLWIAGGFARETCHAHFKLNCSKTPDENNNRIIRYVESDQSSGDIDFFCNNKDVCNKVLRTVSKSLSKQPAYLQSYHEYPSEFANNYRLYGSNRKQDTVRSKVQIVTKFLFDNVKDCFKSFDVTNCKYALEKKENNYILHYDEDALRFDSEKSLALSSAQSPYTLSRIIKYLKYRKLTHLSNETKTQEIFSQCLYKAVENNWPEYYCVNQENYKSNIKMLHNTVNLTATQLSMFIGKIKEHVVDRQVKMSNPSGYGVYVTNVYKDIDWATKEINNACK